MTPSNNIAYDDRELEKDSPRFSEDDLNTEECVAFQSQIPDLLGAGEDLQNHPHMLTCERCRALLSQLESIAEAARQLMPIEAEPPDELWNHIQMAIERGDA
jgi:hypothetical protein